MTALFGFRRFRKRIAVTDLAAYAANPVKYCERRGQAYAPAAARRGTRLHARASAVPFLTILRWFCVLVVLLLAVFLVAVLFGVRLWT